MLDSKPWQCLEQVNIQAHLYPKHRLFPMGAVDWIANYHEAEKQLLLLLFLIKHK